MSSRSSVRHSEIPESLLWLPNLSQGSLCTFPEHLPALCASVQAAGICLLGLFPGDQLILTHCRGIDWQQAEWLGSVAEADLKHPKIIIIMMIITRVAAQYCGRKEKGRDAGSTQIHPLCKGERK